MDTASHPTVGVFTLGGTIAMTPQAPPGLGSGTDTASARAGVVPQLRAADLVAAVPGLAGCGIGVSLHDVAQLPGACLAFSDVQSVYREIVSRLSSGELTGAVVTQGTDTIEETSWLLDLLHPGPAPIVVTGAMRNPAMAGPDGPANLLAAIRVAASTQARELGALVVFNDEIHSSRTVRKTHTMSTATFVSPGTGPIGAVVEGTVRVWHRPGRSHLGPAAGTAGSTPDDDQHDPRVAVLPMTLGQDDVVLRAAGPHLDGLVIAGFGAGHTPAGLVPAVAELAARIPVILASRTGAGPVAASTYGFPGSEVDLLGRGLISAGYLDPYRARGLLHLLLARGASAAGIAAAFDRLGATPVPPGAEAV
jgi:L-asparaginase